MSRTNATGHETDFVREWRAWLDRPVKQSGAAAATRIAGLLRDSRRSRRPVWAVAAAGATIVLVAVICLVPRRISTELPVSHSPAAPVISEPAQPGEVLIWLDEDTPLYMHFQPPASQGGNKS